MKEKLDTRAAESKNKVPLKVVSSALAPDKIIPQVTPDDKPRRRQPLPDLSKPNIVFKTKPKAMFTHIPLPPSPQVPTKSKLTPKADPAVGMAETMSALEIPLPPAIGDQTPLPSAVSDGSSKARTSKLSVDLKHVKADREDNPLQIPLPPATVDSQASDPKLDKKTVANATPSPPLSKIQMLIKQKAEKLKESPSGGTDSKQKSAPLTFGIGKARSTSAAEKVKFSVIKRDNAAPMFGADDEEEHSPHIQSKISPPKVKLSFGPPRPILNQAVAAKLSAKKQELERRLMFSPARDFDSYTQPSPSSQPPKKTKNVELESLKDSMKTLTSAEEGKDFQRTESQAVSEASVSIKSDATVSTSVITVTSSAETVCSSVTSTAHSQSVFVSNTKKESYEADSTMPDEVTTSKKSSNSVTLYSDSEDETEDNANNIDSFVKESKLDKESDPNITSSSQSATVSQTEADKPPMTKLDPIMYPAPKTMLTGTQATAVSESAEIIKSAGVDE